MDWSQVVAVLAAHGARELRCLAPGARSWWLPRAGVVYVDPDACTYRIGRGPLRRSTPARLAVEIGRDLAAVTPSVV